jgi:hypothetical protein
VVVDLRSCLSRLGRRIIYASTSTKFVT